MITLYETADEIEKAAHAAGLNMRLVCATAGFAHTTWYRWRNGTTKPTHEVRLRLGQALNDLRNEAE
jgi:hypothetical protein